MKVRMCGHNVFYEIDGKNKSLFLPKNLSTDKLYEEISCIENIPKEYFKLNYNGKYIKENFIFNDNLNDVYLKVCFPVLGGKGGFGSMLRAIGAQIEKTTNKEACRDLNGRRLRDVNAEKRIKNLIKKKAENEKLMKIKKIKKLERMTEEPKIEFVDQDYLKEKDIIPQKIEDAFDYVVKKNTINYKNDLLIDEPIPSTSSGITSSSSSDSDTTENTSSTSSLIENNIVIKRKNEEPIIRRKKQKISLWLDDDLSSSDEDSN